MVAPCTTLAAQAASGQCFPPAELIDWPLPKSLQQTERQHSDPMTFLKISCWGSKLSRVEPNPLLNP